MSLWSSEEDKNLSVLVQSPLGSKAGAKSLCVRQVIWEVMAGSWRERLGERDREEATMGVLVGSLMWAIWTQFLWGFSEEPIERSLLKIIPVNRWWDNHLSISCHPPPSLRPHWGLPLEVWNTLEVRGCHPEHPGTDGYSLGWNWRWSGGDVMSSPAASDLHTLSAQRPRSRDLKY